MVTGKVPRDRQEGFESGYRSAKTEALPPGLEISVLMRSAENPEAYAIQTIWSSREALAAMRASGKPKAVALFEAVGVTPKVEIHEVAESIP
jgi:heme-degrading monooxygenase HmoA